MKIKEANKKRFNTKNVLTLAWIVLLTITAISVPMWLNYKEIEEAQQKHIESLESQKTYLSEKIEDDDTTEN